MSPCQHKVSLGFTQQTFDPGVHICQIFSNNDERQDAFLKLVLSGLQTAEKTSGFSEEMTEKMIEDFLMLYGFTYSEEKRRGAISLSKTRDVYFKDNRFDPERMVNLLRTFYEGSIKQGFCTARFIGEMTPEVQHLPGGSRLLEYESRISLLLKTYPITAVCQYDARAFTGATVMDVLKVHPLMVVRGSVVHNPFYITPEEYLSSLGD